jgi:hypothetical protein
LAWVRAATQRPRPILCDSDHGKELGLDLSYIYGDRIGRSSGQLGKNKIQAARSWRCRI